MILSTIIKNQINQLLLITFVVKMRLLFSITSSYISSFRAILSIISNSNNSTISFGSRLLPLHGLGQSSPLASISSSLVLRIKPVNQTCHYVDHSFHHY